MLETSTPTETGKIAGESATRAMPACAKRPPLYASQTPQQEQKDAIVANRKTRRE